MKKIITLIILLFCTVIITAQDKIYVHKATASNIYNHITVIDHPDLNGNPNANIVYKHVWNPNGDISGIYNNNIDGLWYNGSNWTIYNEDTSQPMLEGASFFVYIGSNSTNFISHIASVANQHPTAGDRRTVIDDTEFNGSNPGPYAVMSNYYNPYEVYNQANYGFWYDNSIDRRVIYTQSTADIPVNAGFKILKNGTGVLSRYTHESIAANTYSNVTYIDHSLLNGNPNATFVYQHYWGVNGASSNNEIDKVISVFYDDLESAWCFYLEDGTSFPEGIALDIIIAVNDNLFTYVPDDNFEQALIDLGYDSVLDNYVLTANINTVTSLDVSGRSIADLTGIKDFTNLQILDCYDNNLTSLDLSQNLALTGLYCYTNQLTSLNITQNILLTNLDCFGNQLANLDVTQNIALTQLYCYENLLTSLDVTQNTALINLRCYNNNLSNLNVTQNTALTQLYCHINQLTSLDITQNTALTQLYCYSNQLTSLDVTQNSLLINLNCRNNQLTALDVSQNTALTILNVYNNQISGLNVMQNTALTFLDSGLNQLTSLDLTQNTALEEFWCDDNQLTSLDVRNGNNTNIITFYADTNPNLTCISVDDAAWSTTNWANIDSQTSFSEDCSLYLNELEIKNITIYPNPTNNVFKINTNLSVSKIKIYDSLGKPVTNYTQQEEYDVSNLTKGIYIILLESNGKKYQKKLIIDSK